MAYQFQTGVARDTADLMVKIRDFVITTCGWTSLQDTVTTGADEQYFAARSLGENGQERTVLRVWRTTADTISFLGYLNWNAGAGTAQIGSTSGTSGTGTYIRTDDDNYIHYWLFGSLDRIIVFTKTEGRPGVSSMYAGLYTRARSATVTLSTNAESAGTNVTIEVPTTVPFAVGRYYTIADDTNFEWFKVTTINAGTSIVAERLEYSYASGARIGEDPRPMFITTDTQNLGIFNANHYLLAPAWRRVAPSQGFIRVSPVDAGYERASPDSGVGDKVLLWPLQITDESILARGYVGQLLECFVVANEGLATDDTITVGSATYRIIVTAPPYIPPVALTSVAYTATTRAVFAVRQS